MRVFPKAALFSAVACLWAIGGFADTIELTQDQLRGLVSQQQVLSAETIVVDAVSAHGGVVMDIRGFLFEGQMTYRVLLQRDDGSVIELLVNGVNGRRVSHDSALGQLVSTAARSTNGAGNASNGTINRNANANANAGNRDNARDRGNSGGGNSGGGNSGGGNSGGKGRND